MKVKLFKSLVKSLDRLPASEILKVIEQERQMLNEELLNQRVEEQDLASIFSFCDFINAVRSGDAIVPAELPAEYMLDCRKIILRQIEAGELSGTAYEQFNLTFKSN